MSSFTASPVMGEQFTIENGGATATISALAAALRIYQRDGIDLVEPFSADELPPSGSGILMAPWGNRVRAGKWVLKGKEQQLDITEPSRGNASHGLLRNTGYAPVSHTETSVTLAAEIYTQHGFPFRMRHAATYTLDADGHLSVTQQLTNLSSESAPAALGAHPYLRLGDSTTAQLTLTVSARQAFIADESLIPVGLELVRGDTDFRGGSLLADVRVDVALTSLDAAEDGNFHHVLSAPDGRSVELWQEPIFPIAHVFVTEHYRDRPLAVAVEPMTAPADAFNSGTNLHWLEPGESLTGTWGIRSSL